MLARFRTWALSRFYTVLTASAVGASVGTNLVLPSVTDLYSGTKARFVQLDRIETEAAAAAKYAAYAVQICATDDLLTKSNNPVR